MDQKAAASHSRCPYANLVTGKPADAAALVETPQEPAAATAVLDPAVLDPAVQATDGPAHVPGAKCPAKRWGTRAGVAVFAFFLIKGLAWLVVPAAIAAFAMKGD